METAVVTPLLVLLFLGAVDTGQHANCYQKVSDAAREAARFAARSDVSDTLQVESAVVDYLADRFPGVSDLTLRSASTVTLHGELADKLVGSNVEFRVVRWGVVTVVDSNWNGAKNTYVTLRMSHAYTGELRPKGSLVGGATHIDGAYTSPVLVE